jgi:anion-transporting  ArsA/GET3 family ATPase
VDTAQFFAASRVVIVAGKGGVGKTTVAAALATAAARTGLTTLIVEVEGKSGLPALFGQSTISYDESTLAPGGGPDGAADVRARALTPDDALLDYLADHGLNRVSRRLVGSGALDLVATAAPGIRDILILGKVKQIEAAGAHDLIVLDAPAAGHAIGFLRSAAGLLDAVSVGPINTQATEVLALLTDPARCQVMLVTLPEETPVNELVQTAYALEEEVGINLAPVVVNGLYPDITGLDADPDAAAAAAGTTVDADLTQSLTDAARFRRLRTELQTAQVSRLAEQLPLPQIHLPYQFTSDLGPGELDDLASALLNQIAGLPSMGGGPTSTGTTGDGSGSGGPPR